MRLVSFDVDELPQRVFHLDERRGVFDDFVDVLISGRNLVEQFLRVPVFDAAAPALRVKGRQISNWWANLETLWAGVHDSLYGFRVYPIDPLIAVMRRQPWMRRFDFDVEAAVRLSWRGVRPINLPAPVRYFRPEEGGVSHFNYWRDNALLTWMHFRLFWGFVVRLPRLLARRRHGAEEGRRRTGP